MLANNTVRLLATLSEKPYTKLPGELQTTVEIQLETAFVDCTFYERELWCA